MLNRVFQGGAIALARPYIRHELPGWGKVLRAVAGFQRDSFWCDAPQTVIQDKLYGYRLHLDLTGWADRSTYFLGRWYDLEAQLILRHFVKPGDCVVDIGANRGMFALAAAHTVGPRGSVICFVPNPKCVNLLRQELATNGLHHVQVHQTALGDKKGRLPLTIPFQNSGSATLGHDVFSDEIAYKVEVPITVGDELLGGKMPRLVKIDVEGFELNVLKGLQRTIAANKPIILHEVAENLLKANSSSLFAITEVLTSFGYVGFAVGTERRGLRHDWVLRPMSVDCDAIWLRPEMMTEETKSRARLGRLG